MASTSPSHHRSSSSGTSASLLHATLAPAAAAGASSPSSSSSCSPAFSPPPSSFSYFGGTTSPRSPTSQASPAAAQAEGSSPSASLSPRSAQEGGTLRERKGSFSTAILQNLNFWKKGSTTTSSSPYREKSTMSEVIRRGEPNRFLDALHKSKEDGDLRTNTHAPHSPSSPSPSSDNPPRPSAVTEGGKGDTLRALHGLLFNRTAPAPADKTDDDDSSSSSSTNDGDSSKQALHVKGKWEKKDDRDAAKDKNKKHTGGGDALTSKTEGQQQQQQQKQQEEGEGKRGGEGGGRKEGEEERTGREEKGGGGRPSSSSSSSDVERGRGEHKSPRGVVMVQLASRSVPSEGAGRSESVSGAVPPRTTLAQHGRSSSLPSLVTRRPLSRAVPSSAAGAQSEGSSLGPRAGTATRHSFAGGCAPSRSVITPRSSPSSPSGSRVGSPSISPRSSSATASSSSVTSRNPNGGAARRPGSSSNTNTNTTNNNTTNETAGRPATAGSGSSVGTSGRRVSGGTSTSTSTISSGPQTPSMPMAIKEVDLVAPQRYLAHRWAQGKCKPGRPPRIKKLKASERKKPVILVLDGDGVTVLDANSNEVMMAHSFGQIKNWGHREGVKGMHFNYIATGSSKYPEIYDFKSDQALELFERISFQHARKLKESLAAATAAKTAASRSLILASPQGDGRAGAGAGAVGGGAGEKEGEEGKVDVSREKDGSGEGKHQQQQQQQQAQGRPPPSSSSSSSSSPPPRVVVVVVGAGGDNEGGENKQQLPAAAAAKGSRSSGGAGASGGGGGGGEGGGSEVGARGGRRTPAVKKGPGGGAVQRLDKIRWSVLMEGPAVELVLQDHGPLPNKKPTAAAAAAANHKASNSSSSSSNNNEEEEEEDDEDEEEEEEDEEEEEEEEEVDVEERGRYDGAEELVREERSEGLLLSPRSMMARLEKKKSWQDITRNLKKFDFQSEKAKELREERERKEKEKDKEKKKDKDDSGGFLKAAKSAKKSLRVKTLRKDEISIVRNDRPASPSSGEDSPGGGGGGGGGGEVRSFSRGVSFEFKPVVDKAGSRDDLHGDEDPEAEAPYEAGDREAQQEEQQQQDEGEAGEAPAAAGGGGTKRGSAEVDGSSSSRSSIDHLNKSGERKKVDLREEVVKELVRTEIKYVKDLETIVEQYMRRLRENGMVEGPDIATIFSNVDQIRNLNRTLLDSLEGLDKLPTELSDVGARFLSFIEYLRLYTQYCSNQTQAGTRLKELKESKPELHQLLEEMRDLPDVHRLDLESFLIKPMQRLTRYPLFFQQLLKNTPEAHPDYANLRKCLDGLHEVVTTINNQKQRNDNLNKLLLLQRQFLDTKEQPALKLVEATRKFIREGVFVKVIYGSVAIKNCTVILFNDVLVLAVKKGKGAAAVYTPKSTKIPLAGLLVWDEKSVPFGFSVVGREAAQEKLTLQAGSEEEKASWVDEVNAALAHLPNVLRGHRRTPSAVEKYIRHQEPPATPQG